MRPIYISFSERPRHRRAGDDRRRNPRAPSRPALAAQGRGEAVIEPRMHLEPDPAVARPFQRAARLDRRADEPRRREDRRRLRRQLRTRPAVGDGVAGAVRPGDGHAARDPRRHRHHRHAHRRGDRDRGENTSRARNSRVLGHIGARGTAYWNVRLLDRLFDFDEIRVHSSRPRKPATRSRAGSPATSASRSCATADWQKRVERRRHRGRGIAPARTGAAAEDGVDQARRLRDSLRHDERAGTVADRHHDQAGGR